ncbi:MAG: alpha/beta hydrolase [Alphaproteobacteria bacterium]|jgi:acetyl esterase
MSAVYEIEVQDVVYLRVDGLELFARIYRPLGVGPFEGVVEVHGGAWTANDRLTNKDIHMPLAASGVVVMAIDFRMPPFKGYPASVQDVNLAVRWLKSKADDFQIDKSRIGIIGTSSGGHQAMLCALRPTHVEYNQHILHGGYDAIVNFAVLCWPVLDPLARYRMVMSNGNERLFLAHKAFWPDEEAMADGNPQLIVERGEPIDFPPVLVIQGTNDDNLTPDMADRFASAYEVSNGRIQLKKFQGAPHAFIARDPNSEHAKEAIRAIVEFVKEVG